MIGDVTETGMLEWSGMRCGGVEKRGGGVDERKGLEARD